MPSGSKKRKSLKKPKPPGGPPELEAGMEEAMENNELEAGEVIPSPRGFEGDPEAMGGIGLQEGKEMNGEVCQDRDAVPEAPKEGFQTDVAAPDHQDEGDKDPPSQPEPEPEGIEAEAPAVFELEGEPAQSKNEPPIDTPPMEFEAKIDDAPEEIKPEMESNAAPVELEPDTDADPVDIKPEMESDAAPVELEPVTHADAEDIKEEMELHAVTEPVTDATPEETKPEMELHATPDVSEPAINATPDASFDEIIPDTGVGSIEVESSKESSVLERETVLDAGPNDRESGVDESCVEKAVLEVGPNDRESGMDESCVKKETKTDKASEPEIYKAPDEGEVETGAAPAVKFEVGEPIIEVKPEANATSYIDREMIDGLDEVLVEVDPEMDGEPAENEAEMEAGQIGVPEARAPANTELGTEEAQIEKEPETDAAPRDVEAEVEDAIAETEVAPVNVEPLILAAPDDTEAETDTAQVVIDAFPDEIPPEIDAPSPEKESVVIEQDVNVAPLQAEQDEVSQAAIKAAPEPESELEALVEREISAEDVENSAEVEALVEPPLETEAEPKPLDVAEDKFLEPPQGIETLDVGQATSFEPPREIEPLDVAEVTSLEPLEEIVPESEAVVTDEAKPEDKASVEIEAEERGSLEIESEQPDVVEGELQAEMEPVADTIDPQPDAETSHGIELDAEAEVSLEAEPEPGAEAMAEPEVEGETSRGIELDAEAEVPLETEPEVVSEALAADERGPIETEADQQDLCDIELDQSGVKGHDQQLQKHEGAAALGEMDTSVSEDNEPLEIQPQVADASEVLVIEDKPPAISAIDKENSVDDSSSSTSTSTSSSEASDNANNERTTIEQEPEEGNDRSPLATALEGEGKSTVWDVSDTQGDIQQITGTTVNNEQGASDELQDESKGDVSEEEQKVVDVGHDEDRAVLAMAGNGMETRESIEMESAIEMPKADVEESAKEAIELPLVDVQELAKDEICEQERAGDVGHDEDGAVLALAGNGGEVEVSSNQKLGVDELPPADVVDLEELAKEGSLSSGQTLVTDQDVKELGQGLGTAMDEPPSPKSEQSLNASLALSASETTLGAPEPQDEVITPAFADKVASEHGFNLESAYGEIERNDGEEEAASSTVAEAGSVLNDLDERASYEQELHTDFPSVDQEAHITSVKSEQSLNAITTDAPECQDKTSTPANDEKVAPEHEFSLESACDELERDIRQEVATSSTVAEVDSVLNDFDERASSEHTDFPSTDQGVDIPNFEEHDANLSTDVDISGMVLREQSESKSFPVEKVDENAIKVTSELQEVLESAGAAKPAENLPLTIVKELSSDEQLLFSPQSEQVVSNNRKDQVHSSNKEVVLPIEEPRATEEEGTTFEDDKEATNSMLGKSLPMIAGDELISKTSTYLENGQQSLSSSEAPSDVLVEHSVQSEVNMDKAEIHAMDAKELKEAEHYPMGGDTFNNAVEAPVESASLIPEGKDMKGVQAFHQESTKEASLPVVLPAQDRALERVNLNSAEQPSGGGALERRTKLLGCCGMFDLLLGRN